MRRIENRLIQSSFRAYFLYLCVMSGVFAFFSSCQPPKSVLLEESGPELLEENQELACGENAFFAAKTFVHSALSSAEIIGHYEAQNRINEAVADLNALARSVLVWVQALRNGEDTSEPHAQSMCLLAARQNDPMFGAETQTEYLLAIRDLLAENQDATTFNEIRAKYDAWVTIAELLAEQYLSDPSSVWPQE